MKSEQVIDGEKSAVRRRSTGFRIVTGIAQVVLGVVAGYLINWGTALGILGVEISIDWTLPLLLDIWLVPFAVTVGVVAVLWFTLPRIRLALYSAVASSLLTSIFFTWLLSSL
ncbi:hypothetical protein ACFXK0_11845 [Nocardia sp. NPDC059177]|uniref:hypothetical protein n=1 Tax=Nocardia sp. NPDC059177 TaxID=3346759 RepID=UPI00367443EC